MGEFWKYHGLGNDFVVLEAAAPSLDPERVRRICDRHRGVGADGVLVVTAPVSDQAVGRMVVYNRDGSRPEMCGNGIRCVARHLAEHGGIDGESFTVDTDAGVRDCRVVSKEPTWKIAVQMGHARLDGRFSEADGIEAPIRFLRVDMGNPHAVTFRRPEDAVVDAIGKRFNADDPRFPEGTNVEFARPGPEDTYATVVFERGVGRTEACGTGACAVAVAAWETERTAASDPVSVELPGGGLTVDRRGDDVWMTGPAEWVFSGRLGPGID